jgi:nucleoside-diphosphate-sugar epimerase
VNFRIFNIFHINEEVDRFIKACFIAKKSGTNVTIFKDKYFDFMYEDDFIKIIRYYVSNISKELPKTFNLSYTNKYKLSEIAEKILGNKNRIEIIDNLCDHLRVFDNAQVIEHLCRGHRHSTGSFVGRPTG